MASNCTLSEDLHVPVSKQTSSDRLTSHLPQPQTTATSVWTHWAVAGEETLFPVVLRGHSRCVKPLTVNVPFYSKASVILIGVTLLMKCVFIKVPSLLRNIYTA